MHEVDLSKYDLRTDLIIEKNLTNINNNHYQKNDIEVDDITLDKNNVLKKKEGKYITISFKDITDSKNYSNVLEIFNDELSKVMDYLNIKKDDSCLMIGLGNRKIVSDALGSKTIDNIIVTRHMYLLGDVDKKYRNISILEPNVIGVTGIDSFEIIKNVVNEIKPNFLICVDSLCAASIERINKTIQITSSGITPGSGIGNNREELSFDTLGVPVIAIGVPTVVDSTVIVFDTINYLLKKISYLKNNLSNKDKLKPLNKLNYLNSDKELTDEEKKEVLGLIGELNEIDLKNLIWEVLSPINANMIVTTKEIDFIVDKISKLLSDGLNQVLHDV